MKSQKLKILFLDILTDSPKLRKEIHENVYSGKTYSDLMRRAFGLSRREWEFVDAAHEALPVNIRSYDAIVVGGSAEDPLPGRDKPWMKRSYAFLRKAASNDIPILGICGGLQFFARAFGEKVILNPRGRELGTTSLKLTALGAKDPLFKGLRGKFDMQLSHKCMVPSLKPNWKLLVSSVLCGTQAVAVGKKIRLLQFHPELGACHIKGIARMRENDLIKEGFVKDKNEFKKFINSVKETRRVGKIILKNFLKYFVLRN